jgi:hypothetical protein
MFLEFDWTSNTYRSHLGGEFEHSFATLAAARHGLHLIVYASELRAMGTHGGSNSWNLSPSALMPSV